MEKPILFSTSMVQAILDGRKSQTRRVLKVQPESIDMKEHKTIPYNGSAKFLLENTNCRYGQIGDILWVRETYTKLVPEHFITSNYVYKADMTPDSEEIRQQYIKQGYPYKWKPSIFMPKVACRIKLLIKDIQVERLNDISEADAQSEGVERPILSSPFIEINGIQYPVHPATGDYAYSYMLLWNKINGKDSWSKNPWVWKITFDKL